jgi:dienelactone hydrolase
VIGYGSPDAEDLRARAARDYRSYGVPYIRLSRPGVYGSSGDHKERRRPREVALANAALDALKEKYRIGRFALSGQSGGGHLVAALLAFRGDVACAVVTSGVVAVRERIAAKGWTADSTGYADFLDPIEFVARIPRDRNRRIYIVGDPRDRAVPFESQAAYHRALVAAGHDASLVRARASGESHHSLSPLGFLVVNGCLEGVPAPEIAARAADWSR